VGAQRGAPRAQAFLIEHGKDAVEFVGNRTECALLMLLRGWGVGYEGLRAAHADAVEQLYAFSSERKMASVLLAAPGGHCLYNKARAQDRVQVGYPLPYPAAARVRPARTARAVLCVRPRKGPCLRQARPELNLLSRVTHGRRRPVCVQPRRAPVGVRRDQNSIWHATGVCR